MKEASQQEVLALVPKGKKDVPPPTADELDTKYTAIYDTNLMPSVLSRAPSSLNCLSSSRKKKASTYVEPFL